METKAIGRQVYNHDICNMKIAVVAATGFEWTTIQKQVNQLQSLPGNVQVTFHTTGIGILTSTYQITTLINQHHPDIIVQAGIAGSFDESLQIGDVVVVKNEYNGDLGVTENAEFKDVFDLNLVRANEFPYDERALPNTWLSRLNLLHLKDVNAVTVNEITTGLDRISSLKQKYMCSVESMEGAALHYVCLQTQTPFLQLRAISNYIGERDKSKWNIKLALDELARSTTKLIGLLTTSEPNLF